MLAKILLDLSIWFGLSVIVGLVAGRAICAFQKPPAQASSPFLEVDWDTWTAPPNGNTKRWTRVPPSSEKTPLSIKLAFLVWPPATHARNNRNNLVQSSARPVYKCAHPEDLKKRLSGHHTKR